MTKTSKNRLIKAIKEIAEQRPTTIEVEVAQEALLHDDIPTFFEDLSRFGCRCGMVKFLIYREDTHQFFDEHYDEIQELLEEVGQSIRIEKDLKNSLAWFAFEEVAARIYERFS